MTGIELRLIASWLQSAGLLRAEPQVLGTPVSDTVGSACVDSRLTIPGCLFVALPGERSDGHSFVDDAVGRGAVAAFVRADRLAEVQSSVFGSATLYPVDDTLKALQEIARRWREMHPDLVRVGITGSNGKTTTKELVAAMLSRSGPTVYSHGNYNSDIGLPVELLRIRSEHRFGVFELGMNRPGEISELAELVDPDVALITNVGSAHVGMLGSRRRIAEEKKEIFSRFRGDQTAIVPPSGEFSRYLASEVAGTVLRHSRSTAGVVRIENRNLGGTILHLREGSVRLRLPGDHMVANALAALSVARVLNIPFDAMRAGIESVEPMFGRTQVFQERVTVVQDCYNANPESMATALSMLSEIPTAGRRIAILGAMKELGDESAAAHRSVVQRALSTGVDEVWLVGDEFVDAAGPSAENVRGFRYDEWEDLEHDAAEIADGDAVLLKGSRLLELERLTPVIQTGTSVVVGGLVRG
ncbi:MAG: UDP-N-acetylmuramoyl-tripeptide--D-alanyl-D-alanine ligase [Spirochaetales bacterium]|nr:UDP-N-acetylmuramoyl-tripeptide--D-alanyl-D-alanine ligase [Spirochaetales bacterium]